MRVRYDGLPRLSNCKSCLPDGLGRPSYRLKQLYLHSNGVLSFDPVTQTASEFVEYLSDPKKPVPYSKRPIMGFWSGLKDSKEARFQRAGKLWKVEDQRFVHDRPDVVSFVTEPLESDVELAGRITAHLHASTSGPDSDSPHGDHEPNQRM